MDKMKLEEIEVDEDIYPRVQRSPSAVVSYVEALKAGAVFPPITVQRIIDDKETKTISLDGSHRLEAYNTYNEEIEKQLEEMKTDVSQFFGGAQTQDPAPNPILEIEVEHWKEDILDKQEWLEEMRIVSYQLNMRHGVRITETDLAFVAGRIVDARPLEELVGIQKELAERFGKTFGRMSQLIGDKVRRRRASRDSFIFKLHKEGWTQQKIADVVGLKQHGISQIIKNFNTKEIDNLHYNKGVTPEEIADTYRMDTATLWSILLEDKDDLTRYRLFSKDTPTPFNVWYFAARDTRLGLEYAGNIPGQIVLNTLYYYTKLGDLVVDPMAGGGSTIDACLVMGRKCRAFDISTSVVEKRKDIILRDIEDEDFIDEGFGNKKPSDLVFLDPPYYNMVFDQGKTIDEFYDFVRLLCKKSLLSLKTGGYVAFLMADMTEKGDMCLSGESYKIFTESESGFEYVDHISAPSDPNVRARERKKGERKLIGRNRDMYVFRKVRE